MEDGDEIDEIEYQEEYGDDNYNLDEAEEEGKYEFLMKDQFEKELRKKVEEFVPYTELKPEEAELVLIHYNWNLELLLNDWVDKMDKIKMLSGLKQTPESQKNIYKFFKKNQIPKNMCLVCMTEFENENDYLCLGCGHKCCVECYTEYLLAKLDEQMTLLSTPCPLHGCNFIVTSNLFKKCFKNNEDAMNIYNKCLLRNFTESNSDIKLCPNPKCDLCIKVPGHGSIEIKCQCGSLFCFKCLKESHRPCDCAMTLNWEEKNKSEGENAKWLAVNTKQCPHCHKYIEKNQGCNHMTCRKEAGGCGYEFCWICLGEWKPHGTSWYECKLYKPDSEAKAKEKLRSQIKYDLELFADCNIKYSEQVKAQKYAEALKDKIQQYKKILETKKNQSHSELVFFDEAIETVVDCHRILKNTYIFSYYMKRTNNIKCKLYEHNQSILSSQSDKLHELLELDELPNILKINEYDKFDKEFSQYKGHIMGLIGSTMKYRESLLSEIENDPGSIDYDKLKRINSKNL